MRALRLVTPDLRQQLQRLEQPKEVYEQAVLRSLVSQRNMQVSQDGRVYPGYGGSTIGLLSDNAIRSLSTLGNAVGSAFILPALDSVRQALPMVQAILIMALVICCPLITLLSAYELKTVMMLTFVQFALFFLTFWWELARWLDSWLLSVLYDSSTHSYWNLAGMQNTQDDLIVNIVMGTMFLILPVLWLGAMGWAGAQVGTALSGIAAGGTGDVKTTGSMGAGLLMK